jgi:hypothetical protein
MVHMTKNSRMSSLGMQSKVKEKMFYSPNYIIWNICMGTHQTNNNICTKTYQTI